MNLIMRNVEFPLEVDWSKYHSYVANIFWNQKIGKVSEVSLIPYVKYNGMMYVCLVTIREWFDSECGYNFMKRLKEGTKEVRLVYSDDNWWTVEENKMYNEKSVVDCYTVKFEESDLDDESSSLDIDIDLDLVANEFVDELIDEMFEEKVSSILEKNKEVNLVSDDEFDDDCPPPSLERGGNYWCSLCGKGQGGMMSVCDNNNCLWYNKSMLEIAFKDGLDKSVAPTMIPDDSWFNDTNVNDNEDVAPTLIPPSSWLNCGIDLEDTQDEWVKISTGMSLKCDDEVGPSVMPPLSWLTEINVDIPEFSKNDNYFCGICGESKKGLFSICWNKSCERYNKSIDDIYEENFNLKDLNNVTLRKHQKEFHNEISL
jgi:hypothetical protein